MYVSRKTVCTLFVTLCCVWAGMQSLQAQCITVTPTNTYYQDFESSNGNWTPGGSGSDWAWGAPSKPVINKAASGFKCWITGGLTTPGYNNNENSWLQSPCFDLSALQNPYLSFSVFWETEKKYDGASLEYSINGGPYTLLGSTTDATNCPSSNWFNTPTITYLGTQGWSGNIQQPSGSCGVGSGSSNWVIAGHSLQMLAGQKNVQFRFVFAAGSTCNYFDGFAVDNISISEAPSSGVDFSYACGGNNAVNITSVMSSTNSSCPQSYTWDFGDNTTSQDMIPSHTYASQGTYTITLTVAFSNGTTASANKSVTILNVTTQVTSSACGDSTGKISALVTGGSGTYNYSWNTTPVQTTSTISHLARGTYTVTITADNSCTITSTATVTSPPPIIFDASTADAKCGNNGGAITTNVTGGTPPYDYTWSTGNQSSFLSNLPAGNYSLHIIDGSSCTTDTTITVNDLSNKIAVTLGNDTAFCPGQQMVLNAGIFNKYLWQDGSTNPTYTVTQSGKYWVQVTDIDGCTASDTIIVTVDCSGIYFPTGISPNGDLLNDTFGPLGNLAALSSYSLSVYNRFGQLIFYSTDPYKRWNGRYNGNNFDAGTTLTWFATYTINGLPPAIQKGTLTIIR